RVMAGPDEETVILVGGGDPLLTAADLRRLAGRTAAKLKKEGVRSVVLDVDDYLFPRPTDARGWEPGDSPTYAAAVRPLAMLGEYSRDTVSTALAVFVRELQGEGISARVGERAVVPDDSRRIAVVARNTLADAIELMLRVSENNVAEVLFRQVALARGYPATWSASTAAAKETLRELDLTPFGMKLYDGSGLSMDDRLTAKFLTTVLDLVVDPAHRELAPIRRWMPVAGETGTLTNRFSSPPASCARGAVFAKTGSLTGVNTLAGLTRAPDGTWRSFAVMVNHRPPDYAPGLTSAAIDAIAATVHGCA
ncbi:MAG: D-alanyl-D-alanine carboxypeptidase/D-alanyl-D-alanine-endopeptidase, partial [bacterium]